MAANPQSEVKTQTQSDQDENDSKNANCSHLILSGSYHKNVISNEKLNNEIKSKTIPLTLRTPVKSRISGIQKELQEQISSSIKKRNVDISPTIAQLRNTPASSVAERRQRLVVKHDHLAKQSGQHKISNGGICLWPQMNSTRLTIFDALWLLGQGVLLSFLTVIVLIKFHDKTFRDIQNFTLEMKTFCDNHQINMESEVMSVSEQVTLWHKAFLLKTENLEGRFDLSAGSPAYSVYLLFYVMGLSGLFYCLVDSLRAKNRLTPSYMRIWICLLFVVCTWTVVICTGLFHAYQLELQAIHCVQQYSLSVGKIGSSVMDLAAHQSVLLYWKSRLLDSNSRGLLHIFGPMTVKDLVNYLVYYSAPILTVLLGPIIRLFMSCWNVYGNLN